MLQKDFAKDTSLPDGPLDMKWLEMRAMLEEPIGQKYIGQFAKQAMTQASGCRTIAMTEKRWCRTGGVRVGNIGPVYCTYCSTFLCPLWVC